MDLNLRYLISILYLVFIIQSVGRSNKAMGTAPPYCGTCRFTYNRPMHRLRRNKKLRRVTFNKVIQTGADSYRGYVATRSYTGCGQVEDLGGIKEASTSSWRATSIASTEKFTEFVFVVRCWKAQLATRNHNQFRMNTQTSDPFLGCYMQWMILLSGTEREHENVSDCSSAN